MGRGIRSMYAWSGWAQYSGSSSPIVESESRSNSTRGSLNGSGAPRRPRTTGGLAWDSGLLVRLLRRMAEQLAWRVVSAKGRLSRCRYRSHGSPRGCREASDLQRQGVEMHRFGKTLEIGVPGWKGGQT